MMNHYLSVYRLSIRSKLTGFLLVLLGQILVSMAGFYLLGYHRAEVFGGGKGDVFLGIVFLLAYSLCLISCFSFFSKTSKMSYTLQRLKISERAVILLDACANATLLFLFLVVEILIVCSLALIYKSNPLYSNGPQGIVIALYRSSFFHGLLPLKETGLWFRNILYVLSAGLACAYLSFGFREKYTNFSSFIFTIMALDFSIPLGRETYIFPAICLIVSLILVIRIIQLANNGKGRKGDPS